MANYTHQNETIYDTQAEQDLPSPDGPEDPEILLNAWLGELDTLTAVSCIILTPNRYITLLVVKFEVEKNVGKFR